MVTGRHAVRNNVGIHAGYPADHRSAPNPAILLNSRQTAQYHALPHMHMACERCVVGKIGVVLDDAIVTDVAVGHEVAVIPDASYSSTATAADAHRYAFAYGTIRTYGQASIAKIVISNLALAAENRLRMHDGPCADLCAAGHHHVRQEANTFTEDAI